MTLGYAVQSLLEILGVVGLVIAMIFDDKLSDWEHRMWRRIKRRLFGKKANVISFNNIHHDGRAV